MQMFALTASSLLIIDKKTWRYELLAQTPSSLHVRESLAIQLYVLKDSTSSDISTAHKVILKNRSEYFAMLFGMFTKHNYTKFMLLGWHNTKR